MKAAPEGVAMQENDPVPLANLVPALRELLGASEKECAGLRAENDELRKSNQVQAALILELERKNQEWARLFPSAVDRVNGVWGATLESLSVGMLEAGRKIEGSSRARKAAQSKNAGPRAWVASEWESRTDKGQSKMSFARQYAQLLRKQFPDSAAVNPETIYRDWLPKGKA